jgi:hypothetical protein
VAFFYAPKIIGRARTMDDVRSWKGQWWAVGVNEMMFVGQRGG